MSYAGRSPQAILVQKFHGKAGQARKRGIPFLLTYKQFVWLWERALGPNWRALSGAYRGQYCMARFGDRGPYEVGNVAIILSTENISQAKTGRYNFSHLNGVLGLPG